MGEAEVGFGLMSISNPNAAAFSDAGNATTYIPIMAWKWNDDIHIVPGRYAMQIGSLGGPDGARAPLLPSRHNMPIGRVVRIDDCTLSVFEVPRIGPWRRISSRCPDPRGASESHATTDEFRIERDR